MDCGTSVQLGRVWGSVVKNPSDLSSGFYGLSCNSGTEFWAGRGTLRQSAENRIGHSPYEEFLNEMFNLLRKRCDALRKELQGQKYPLALSILI
jgi:hypothetical protein